MMIEANDVSCKYRFASEYTIRNASLNVKSTGVIAIVGPSGVGKSTLIALLSGIYGARDEIIDCLDGTIKLDGSRPDELRGPRTISWVPQQPALLDHLTIRQNVMLPLSLANKDIRNERLWAEECLALMNKLGLGNHVDDRPRQLSGGMRTRVSVARAIITQPQYLFLDEPFVSLDVANRWIMYQLLNEKRQNENLCTVITTHNIPEAMLLANRILLMGSSGEGTARRTTIEIVENDPIDLSNAGLDASFVQARTRARDVERLIYVRR